MQVNNPQLGENACWCDKHDEVDDNSDEMVEGHKRFSDVEKEEVDLLEEAWIEEISLRLRGRLDKEILSYWKGGHILVLIEEWISEDILLHAK